MPDRNVSKSPAGNRDPDGPKGLLDGVDAVLAMVLIALCGFFYWLSSDFPVPGLFLGENVLPEQFPRLLLVSIGILALLLPIEHRLELFRWPLIRKARGAPTGTGTFVTMGCLPLLRGERRWRLILIYAVVFTAIVTYLFSIVLSVYFEPGVFGLTLR